MGISGIIRIEEFHKATADFTDFIDSHQNLPMKRLTPRNMPRSLSGHTAKSTTTLLQSRHRTKE
jgi:hypothetical protein